MKKMNFIKNFKKGFTLIELLVVVAIIGILASVVLASLNSARNKGADAAIKANMANARAQAEIFYDSTASPINTYTNVCTASGGISSNLSAAIAAGSTGAICQGDAGAWAMAGNLKNAPGFWCVDSTGASKGTQGSTTNAYTAVTGTTTAALLNSTDYICN